MLLHYLISHNISTVFFEGDYEIRIGFIIFAVYEMIIGVWNILLIYSLL